MVGIHGGTDPATRQAAIDQFQTDPKTRLFVMTTAAQENITLTAAQTLVFFDLPWSPAYVEQIEDRLHRIGQRGTVNVYRLLAQDTVETKTILKNLQAKEELQRVALNPAAYV